MRRFSLLLGAVLLLCCAAAAPAPPQKCQFTFRPLAVGDQASETLRFAIDLRTVRTQEGQVIDVREQNLERREQSVITRLPTAPGETAKARITYDVCEQTTRARGGATNGAERPVAGKTYIAARVGEELVITTEDGQPPPEEEHEIVSRSMQSLGRPNPLSTFLNGRTIAVGEKFALPAEFSRLLLAGWDDSLAKLPVEVILMGTEHVDGSLCALLHTPPPAADTPAAQRVPIEGKFLVELATCRVAQVELRGTIATTERRGPHGQEFDLRRKGKMQVAVHIQHQRAR